MSHSSLIKAWLPAIVTVVLFYTAGRLALSLSLPPSYATFIWPPAGIGLAAVLLWGYRILPGIFLAELLLTLEARHTLTLQDSLEQLLVFSVSPVSSVISAMLGCVLVKKFAHFPNELISVRLIVLFFLLAGPVSTFLPTVLSIYSLFATGVISRQDLGYSFLIRWLGDCMGIAIFTPLFFICFDRTYKIWRQRFYSLGLPLALVFVIVVVTYKVADHKEVKRLQKIINQQSQSISEDLQNGFQRHLSLLSLYKEFHFASQSISEEAFQLFSLSAFNQYADLSRLEWLEAQYAQGRYHFISKYLADNKKQQSIDFYSLTDLANKLDFSPATAVTVIGKNEFTIFMPVFETGEKSCHCLKGLIAEIINSENFVNDTVDRGNFEYLVINLFLDISGLQQISFVQANDNKQISDPLALTTLTSIDLGRHKWILQVAPDKQFLSENYSWTVWQLLAGGMFITSLISIGLLVLTGQNESIRSEVDKRTEELKQSNGKLAASEQQFRKMVQSLSAIVWRIDPASKKFLFVNNEAEKLLGYKVEQWLNEINFCMQHIHQDDKEVVRKFFQTGLRNQRDHEIEFRMIAVDGRCVWVRNFIDLVLDNDEITEIYGFMIDITEHKRMEEQLRLAAITFESQQGIIITDKNLKILQVNKAFTEITGFSQEKVLGKSPRILNSGHHDQAYFRDFWQQLITHGRFEGEMWNRRESGEIYPEWQTVTAVKNNAGEITHYVSVFFDITEKKEAEDKIHAMAFYDPLTNLPNRRLLLQRFDQELAIAKRHKQFGAVIFLDLDHFKLLNDSQGHLVGDELLIQVANRLSSALREEDTPARLGGDEFVVLLHANSASLTAVADHAMIVAEKIRIKLNEPFMLNQYQHHISPSIGIALFPENDKNAEAILQEADTAMYRSKGSGRNTINFFHPSMQQAADLRLTLEQDLREAIEHGRFVLCYQPQVDDNGILLGAEALIRWEHYHKGILLPVDFISVAEESSLILDIGQWVLLEACNQIKAWQDAGVKQPHIAINVSSRQFRQQNFVSQVKYALETSGIAGHLLGIELTESVMIIDIEDTVAKMQALKNLGIIISVDDFGTGYSSLMYLKQLPINVLKIDQAFVRDILADGNDAVIVETIISMAKHLGLKAIAEGVETGEQLAFLRQLGCQAFQGYYFSRPVYAVDFAEKYFVNDMKQI